MADRIELLLTDLTKEVRTNTESYIRLETTLRTELEGLRSDSAELKSSLNLIAQTQANHGERLVANETRIDDLQEVRRDISNLREDHASMRAEVKANAPVRTHWAAAMSAIVALAALAYAFFGK